ncbi:MAG: hypothetical protein LBK74_11985 [Treponema sp.]|jgi:hypothetical protein|nr:hypothetical protein [Treponema sp.]
MKRNIVLMLLLILFIITNCTLFNDGNDDNKTVYISLLDLKYYHDYACKTLDDARTQDSGKIISLKKYEAKERGLKPCTICNP